MNKFIAALSLSLVATLPAPVRAQTAPAEALVRAWLKDLQVEGATVETGALEVDKATGAVTVKGLVYARPLPGKPGKVSRVKVAEARLTGLKGTDTAISAQSIAVTNVEATADEVIGSVKLATLEASDLDLPKLSRLVADPAHPLASHLSFMRELGRARAKTVTLGAITVTNGDATLGSDATHEGLSLTDLGEGRVGSLRIGKLVAKSRAPAGQGALEINPITLTGLDLGAYIRLIDDGAYPGGTGDGQWRPFIQSLVFEGLKSTAPDSVSAFARIEFGALKLRQFARPIGAQLEKILISPQSVQADPAAAGQFGAMLVDSVLLDGAQVRDLKMAASAKAHVNLASLDLKGFSARGIDQLAVTGLDLQDTGGQITLQSGRLAQLAFPSAGALEEANAARRDGKPVDIMPLIPTFSQLGLEALDLKPSGRAGMSLASASIENRFFIGPIPTNILATIKNLRIPVSAIEDAGPREALTRFGLDMLDISFDVGAIWSDGANEISFDRLTLGLGKFGALTFSGAVTGVTKEFLQNPRDAAKQLAAAGIRKGKLVFRDDGATNKGLAIMAAQSNQPVEAIRKALSSNMPGILAAIADTTIRNRLISVGIAFLNDPKSLELISTSNDPIPVAAIAATAMTAPQNLPTLLKLDAFANRK